MVDIEQLREALQHLVIFDARDNISHEVGRAQATSRIVKDSLRELLALKENGQTVWWCEKHKKPSDREWYCKVDSNLPFPSCRMVKASLHIHREGT
jgi:hypothetical protein